MVCLWVVSWLLNYFILSNRPGIPQSSGLANHGLHECQLYVTFRTDLLKPCLVTRIPQQWGTWRQQLSIYMLTLALEVTSFELDLQVTHCPFINPSVIPFFLLALPSLLGDSEGISRIYLYFFFFSPQDKPPKKASQAASFSQQFVLYLQLQSERKAGWLQTQAVGAGRRSCRQEHRSRAETWDSPLCLVAFEGMNRSICFH